MTQNKNRYRKNEAIVGVRLEGMEFCSHVEACSPFFSLIMLCCGGLEWPWVRDSLAYGTEMCWCV